MLGKDKSIKKQVQFGVGQVNFNLQYGAKMFVKMPLRAEVLFDLANLGGTISSANIKVGLN